MSLKTLLNTIFSSAILLPALGHCRGRKPHYSDVDHSNNLFQLDDKWEPCNKVGFLKSG